MRGRTDVLVREGPVGPCVALTHHTLANKVDPTHDEEREDDADDGPDGTAVARAFVQGRLGDFCQGTDRKRGQRELQRDRLLCGDPLGPGGTGSAWGQHSLTEGQKEGMPPTRCPPGLPGALNSCSFLSSSSPSTWLSSMYILRGP